MKYTDTLRYTYSDSKGKASYLQCLIHVFIHSVYSAYYSAPYFLLLQQ